MTTRLIVKNLPSTCTEQQLRKFFEKYGKISDASLKYTKEGKFRGFAFVGFLDEGSASNAIAKSNQTFFNSKRLTVEECRPFGDANKPRAWSKYAKDSSAYKRAHGDDGNGKPGRSDDSEEPSAKKQKNDPKLDQFLEAKGVAVEKEVKLSKDKSAEAKKLMAELMDGIQGDTSLSLIFSGLPSSAKGKNIKEWLNPIRVKAMKIARNEDVAAAFVTFNRPPDVRRALQKDGQFLGGFKIGIEKVPGFLFKILQIETPEPEKETVEEHGAEFESREKEEESVREKILETGRLFLRNLPYATKEDDLQFLFKKYGEVSEVQVVIDKKTGSCKGFAIVEFVFPEAAVAAYSALDGYVFKGRMMHIIAGDEKRDKPTEEDAETVPDDPDNPMKATDKKEKKKKTFKEEKQDQKKADAGKTAHSWNALFLGANAIADTLAQRLNVKKSDLLTSDQGESAGVRLALAETRLVRETRDFFLENGVKLDAFSKPAEKRSDTVMIAKNLPSGVETEELKRMFEKFGDCQKVLMPAEGGVSALVIMGNPVDAKKAFRALAYSRFRSQPLYLEWAPFDVMGATVPSTETSEKTDDSTKPKKSKREMTYEEKKKERKNRQQGITEEEEEKVEKKSDEEEVEVPEDKKPESSETKPKKSKQPEKEIESGSTIFVKNLAFDTTDYGLETLFRKRYGDLLKSAQISKKLNPAEPTKPLSMGFGFVQFYTAFDAKTALKEMQGELLDGHSLELKISHREVVDKGALKRKDVQKKDQGECTKLLVRNLPFEASIKEVETLFETFGAVKTIRIPRKPGQKQQHRGFGFVDFISADEARRAFDALVHSTHLYGRRLVLEWAKEDETVEELREKTAEKFAGNKKGSKKSKAQIEEFQQQLQIADDEKD
ncbi:CRE-RBD-1 protein [Caenorhabditis remanei]|uniref:CRE-RBD-1 protein n=1 Tax=Caenorhabditis remanei TaxID=31234 RepID=E3M6I9_CAERE|nr:CRE-RBD-1 protein [Caenorhabditis remanei]